MPSSADSRSARRSRKGVERRLRSSRQSKSQRTTDAGMVLASIFTREAAGQKAKLQRAPRSRGTRRGR